MANKKKTGALKVAKRIRLTASAMRELWADFFKLYAEEIKPYQEAQALTAHRNGRR